MCQSAQHRLPGKLAIRCSASPLAGVLLALCVLSAKAPGQTTFNWVEPGGGSFTSTLNWAPTGIPGPDDTARFSTFNTAYTVGFIGSPTNARLLVNNGDVTFEPLGVFGAARTYTITGRTTIDGGALTIASVGADTLELNSETMGVGDFGTGTLTIENGGSVSNIVGSIANVGATTGAATVRGAGSTWNALELNVSISGSGTLTIEDGGSVDNARAFIARNFDSTGLATVRGTGTMWNNSEDIVVGLRGNGTLTIEEGGSVTSQFGSIALESGSIGQAIVRGTETIWNNSEDLIVGVVGNGTLTIEDGGSVANADGSIARNPSTTSEVMVRGAGSTWTNTDLLTVGTSGQGTLTIEDGGTVSNYTGIVGFLPGSVSRATVRGAGSMWVNSSNLFVANSGDGTLTIEDGGSVTDADGSIALNPGSTGQAVVRGAGSMWNNSNGLIVGILGSGTLTIEDGGRVANADGSIARNPSSTSEVMVRGAGSMWDNSGGLFVGGDSSGNIGGSGTLTIESGGVVSSGEVTRIYADSEVNLNSGTLSTGSFEDLGGEFNWESGTVILSNPVGFTLGTGAFQFTHSGVALNANQSLGVSGPLTVPGDGALSMLGGDLNTGSAEVQPGGRIFLLRGNHDFGTGLVNHSTAIFDSTTVSGPVTSPAGSTITVLGDVTFNDLVSGAGGFFGPGTANFNGGHDPGDSPAVVAIEGSLAYGSGNTLTVELGGLLDGEFDRLEILGDAALDGNLAVDVLAGFTPGFGDTFEILDVGGTLSGQFIGLDDGATLSATGGEMFRINYGGNNVLLTFGVALPGDINLDGDVNREDVSLFSRYYGTTAGAVFATGDFDADGTTGAADLAILQANLGRSSSAASAPASAVPEPGTTSLAVLALATALVGGRWKGRVRRPQGVGTTT